MKLSKALKLKNKKLKECRESSSKLRYNSYDIDVNKVYNAKEYWTKYTAQVEDFIKLKTAIHTTSEPIRYTIFRLSELKSMCSHFSGIDTTEGTVKNSGYGGETIKTYKADITETEKVAMVKEMEEEIERLQEEIDNFNATTDLVGY